MPGMMLASRNELPFLSDEAAVEQEPAELVSTLEPGPTAAERVLVYVGCFLFCLASWAGAWTAFRALVH